MVMIRILLRTFVGALVCLGGLVLLVTLAPPRWYALYLSESWPEPRGAVLIVLGADVIDNGMLGQSSYWRSLMAVSTWKSSTFRQVVLSGDYRTTAPMRDFIVCQGVPAEAVLIEGRSTSTRENALFTAPSSCAIYRGHMSCSPATTTCFGPIAPSAKPAWT